MKKAPPVLLSLAVCPFLAVEATWSILAIDKRTDRIGAAMATCLDKDYFPRNAADFLEHGFSAVPYGGGIMAQANIQDGTGPAATVGRAMLEGGTSSARGVVDAMADPGADPGDSTYTVNDGGSRTYPTHELRQYGVVTYDEADPVATYTGGKLTQLYGDFGFGNTEETAMTSVTENYTVSVQGNIVYPGTVNATHYAFVNGEDFGGEGDFRERLFHALKAGYEATGGDVRCAYDERLKGAILAFLKVVDPGGERSIDLEANLGGAEGRSALDSIEEGLGALRDNVGAARPPASSDSGHLDPEAEELETPSAPAPGTPGTAPAQDGRAPDPNAPDPDAPKPATHENGASLPGIAGIALAVIVTAAL